MGRLKADLHTHTGDDPQDGLGYSVEMLIEAAARLEYQVLAVSCHRSRVFSERLAEYAQQRGVLLMPAIELTIEKKHVVVLNPSEAQCRAKSFAELRAARNPDAVVIAPHPYYPSTTSLHRFLDQNIGLFDAIEYCSLHIAGVNLNRRAVRMAQRHGLPLVGTSDAHCPQDLGKTYSIIEAEPTIRSVIQALRAGHVEVVTQPVSFFRVLKVAFHLARDVTRCFLGTCDQEVLPS